MTADPDDGIDEPTVVGYRPLPADRRGAPAASSGERGRGGERAPGGDAGFPLPGGHAGAMPRAEVPHTGSIDVEVVDLTGVEEPREPEDVLAAAAAPLLALVAEIRNAVTNADVDALRRATVEEIKAFELRAVRFGARAGDVTAARYVLCAMLDETVMSTPWGNASHWSSNSLLNQFHGETWGGEKVFVILDRVKADPGKYLALIKLIALCLAFGFEGRYRVIEGGRYQIDELRDELSRMLRGHLKAPPPALSPQAGTQGVRVRRRLKRYLPPWIVFAVAGVGLVALYGVLGWQLASRVGPVTALIDGIASQPVPTADRPDRNPLPDDGLPVRSVLPQ